MGIYWILVVLIFLAGVLNRPCLSKSRTKVYLWIVFLVLFYVSGFRAFSVGADTKEYVRVFNAFNSLDIMKSRYEIGFLYYIAILHKILDAPEILVIASSAICIGTACVFVYKFSKKPVLSMMLYILLGAYFSQMNVMRQAIALSVLEVSFMVLLKGNGKGHKIISGLLIILAATIHAAAIVGAIPWVVLVCSSAKKEHRGFTAGRMLKNTIWIAGIAFMAYAILMAAVMKLFPQYAGYFSGTWSDSNYNASLFNTLIQLSFAIVGTFAFRNKELNKVQRFGAIMLSLTIIFDVLSMRMEIWGRIVGFFNIYTYLLWIPEVVSEIHGVKNRAILNVTIVLFSAAYMLVILVYRPEWTCVVPYRI